MGCSAHSGTHVDGALPPPPLLHSTVTALKPNPSPIATHSVYFHYLKPEPSIKLRLVHRSFISFCSPLNVTGSECAALNDFSSVVGCWGAAMK